MQRRIFAAGGTFVLSSALLAQTPRPGLPGLTGAPPAATATGTGLILGQVVDGSSGEPIDNATVTLVSPAREGRGRAGDDRILTGGHGRFVFHDLPAGSFSLQVSAAGYVTGAYGQSRPNGPSRPITLVDGQRVGDARIRLWKLAVVSGTVVDEIGEAAVGVKVVALRRGLTGGRPSFSSAGFATTDDRGQFRIATLVPGAFVIAIPETQVTMPVPIVQAMMDSVLNGRGGMLDFVASGGPMPSPGGRRIGDDLLQSPDQAAVAPALDGRIGAYLAEFYPASASIAQASVVTLQSGEEHDNVDMQLRVATTAAITGRVIGPGGPLSNATVRLAPAAADDAPLGDDFASAITLTRADGSFTMLGVAPGQYTARVVKLPRPSMPPALGGAGAIGAMIIADSGASSAGQTTVPLYGQAAVTVSGGDVAGVSIALREGAKLSGRVEFTGAAAMPQARQLQSISVTLNALDGRDVGSTSFFGGPPQPAVDANRQFKTRGYPPGRYLVTVGGSPGSAWSVESVVVNGRDVLTTPLELSTADVEDVVITYTDKSTRLSGAVRGLRAGATATVVVFPADYRTWLANGMSERQLRQVSPGTSGAWVAGGLPPGDYLAAALDAGDVGDTQDPSWFDAVARVATRVSLAGGETKTLDLTIARIK